MDPDMCGLRQKKQSRLHNGSLIPARKTYSFLFHKTLIYFWQTSSVFWESEEQKLRMPCKISNVGFFQKIKSQGSSNESFFVEVQPVDKKK